MSDRRRDATLRPILARLRWPMMGVVGALSVQVGQASAGGLHECSVVGEIVEVNRPEHLVLIRASSGKQDDARTYTPLYPGDRIFVTGDDVRVFIRTAPQEDRHRITRRDGEYTVPRPTTCDLGPSWQSILSDLPWAVRRMFDRPLPAEPRVTAPGRASDDLPQPPFELIGFPAVDQLVTSDLTSLAMAWRGPHVEIRLIDPSNGSILARTEADHFANSSLNVPDQLPMDRALSLEVVSKHETIRRKLRVVPSSQLPPLPGITSLANLSPAEGAIYAAWLFNKGLPEWHLQALTMLSARAQHDYLAWRLWRGIIADDLP